MAESLADNVANNLANINTTGFKQTLLQIESAPTLDIYRIQTDPGQRSTTPLPGIPTAQYVGPLGTGTQIYDTPTSFEQGALKTTGNTLDLAITGTANAFFSVQTPNGVRYTRNGEFVQDQNGILRTQDGDAVLSTTGQPIQLSVTAGAAANQGNAQATPQPAGSVTVASDGTISQSGVALGQLALTSFASTLNLRPEGANNFAITGNAGPAAATGAIVQQGMLEASNGNVIRSMVDLITAERWFDANEKSMKTQDDATNTAISKVTGMQ